MKTKRWYFLSAPKLTDEIIIYRQATCWVGWLWHLKTSNSQLNLLRLHQRFHPHHHTLRHLYLRSFRLMESQRRSSRTRSMLCSIMQTASSNFLLDWRTDKKVRRTSPISYFFVFSFGRSPLGCPIYTRNKVDLKETFCSCFTAPVRPAALPEESFWSSTPPPPLLKRKLPFSPFHQHPPTQQTQALQNGEASFYQNGGGSGVFNEMLFKRPRTSWELWCCW